MGSREEATPHQPLLSSLVVRPSDSGGGGGSDYEPGEVRRDRPPYSRSDRFSDDPAFVVAWCKNVDLEEGFISGNTGFELGWGFFSFGGLNGNCLHRTFP
uniref:Uncharacterized protein n=2 Tax=Opuntia streptacantha TaxID=393608 RepID=A0A7C9AV63_OPUST